MPAEGKSTQRYLRICKEMKNWFVLFLVLVSDLLASQEALFSQSLKGKVTDISGNPLAGASITISGTYMGTHAGTGGDYSLTGLKKDSYIIRFSFIGYQTLTREEEISTDVVLNVQLRPLEVITNDVIISATRAGDRAPRGARGPSCPASGRGG